MLSRVVSNGNSRKKWWAAAVIAAACLVAMGSYVFLGQSISSATKTKNARDATLGPSSAVSGFGGARGLDMPTQAQRSAESSRLWTDYRASKVGSGAAGSDIIGTIAAIGFLPSTRANVDEALSLLKSNITKEEKVDLLRLLGVNLYWDTKDPSIRADIARILSATALESDDKDIINAATLVYTRLGYFPNSLAVLDRAYKLGAITQQDHYGEMAHMFPFAPSADQLMLIRNIEAGKNDFSRDVLVGRLANPLFTSCLSPDVQASAVSLLAKWEPDLGDPHSGFGGVEATIWQHWLGASVALNAQLSGEPERAAMAKLLKVDEAADPRKLIAALWTEPSAEIVKAAFDRGTLARIDAKVAAYGVSNPNIEE
ncbi:MAG TPA: hypothetical protein VLJ57_14295, partial [Burkholderiaceae bacterium]|nr:hypothetical protein [Burkholderiaceae bacterium]